MRGGGEVGVYCPYVKNVIKKRGGKETDMADNHRTTTRLCRPKKDFELRASQRGRERKSKD